MFLIFPFIFLTFPLLILPVLPVILGIFIISSLSEIPNVDLKTDGGVECFCFVVQKQLM